MGSTKHMQQKYLKGLSDGEKIGKGRKGTIPGSADPVPVSGPKKQGGMGRRDGARVYGKPTHGA